MNLFSSEESENGVKLELPGADIIYFSGFFSSETASAYFRKLQNEIEWQHDEITVFGKTYKQPRLTALYGTNDLNYSYSGISMSPKTLTPALADIKHSIEKVSDIFFTTVLLNLYRDGNDSNGWHSDDEKELGQNPIIASMSFGAERVFQLRNKSDKSLRKNILLEHGSLLLMKGATQHNWQHQIPKSKKVTRPRMNLTFRRIE